MPAVLLPNGKQQFFTTPGVPAVGYKLATFAAGTSTPQTTWADALKVAANANPIILDARGEAVIFWDGAYKIQLLDPAGAPVWPPVDNVQSQANSFSATLIPGATNTFDIGTIPLSWRSAYLATNLYLGPNQTPAFDPASGNIGYTAKTPAETSAGVAVVDFWYPVGNVLRYGLVPNSLPAAANNTAILKTLLNYNTTGPTGRIYFPNTTGADTYFVTSGVCTVRQFVNLDLGGCTISISGAATVNDVNTAYFYPLSDVTIENGIINTAIDTTLAINSGACIAVGARGTGFYWTVYDSLLGAGKSQGRVILRNLTLSSANTGGNSNHVVDLTGGLSNVLCENLTINCGNVIGPSASPINGIDYEWGWATSPSGTITTQTSHGHNLFFKNIRVVNSGTAAIQLTGAYNATIDGLFAQNCLNPFVYSIGEAMFYLPWAGVDQAGAKRNIALRNIVGQTITGSLQLLGSNLASGTYLASAGLTAAQQTDLMTFTLENFAVPSLFVSGRIVARNGKIDGGGTIFNPLVITDDCREADFTNVDVLNGTSSGIRANIAGTGVWATPRQKNLRWNGGIVAGNVTGFDLNNIRSAIIKGCQIGYNVLNDGQGNEATQTLGVNVNNGCQGVVCDSNFVTVGGGGTAYSITGTTSGGCNLVNPLGNVTSTGAWAVDGTGSDTGTNLISAAATINAKNKYLGKRCMNNTTNKMFIAQGSAATGAGGGTWISTDGVTTLTPV